MGKPKEAVLTINEEVTLRRIAHGIVRPSALKQSDVEKLTRLKLVSLRGTALMLTALGERRVSELPRPNLGTEPLRDDQHVATVAKALGVRR